MAFLNLQRRLYSCLSTRRLFGQRVACDAYFLRFVRLAFSAVVLLYIPVASYAATWALSVIGADNARWSIDKDSVSQVGPTVDAWIKTIPASSDKSASGAIYSESQRHLVLNCDGSTASIETTIYLDPSGRIVDREGAKSGQLRITKASILDRLALDVCNQARGGKVTTSQMIGQVPPASEWLTTSSGYLVLTKSIEVVDKNALLFVTFRTPSADEKKIDQRVTYVIEKFLLGCNTLNYTRIALELFNEFGNSYEFNDLSSSAKDSVATIVKGSNADGIRAKVCTDEFLNVARPKDNKERDGTENKSGSFGTAWLSDYGYVVTAFHVVADRKSIIVMGPNRKPLAAKLVASDQANDIALLEVDFPPPSPRGISLSKSPPSLATRVFTIGFPHPDLMGFEPKFTSGEVSALSGIRDDRRVLQISVPVQSGNSGGPLLNVSGEAVGVISAKLSAAQVLQQTGDLTQNVNYAVKARYLQGLLDDLGKRAGSTGRLHGASIEESANQAKEAIFLIYAE